MDVTALTVKITNSQTSFENHCLNSNPLYESDVTWTVKQILTNRTEKNKRCETKKKFTGSYTEVNNFSVMYCDQTNFWIYAKFTNHSALREMVSKLCSNGFVKESPKSASYEANIRS